MFNGDFFLRVLGKFVFGFSFFGILIGVPTALIKVTSGVGFIILIATLVVAALGALTTMAVVVFEDLR